MKLGYRSATAVALATLGVSGTAFAGSGVIVNEVFYDSPGSDTGTFTELRVFANTDFTGWTLEGVNGNGGAVYTTIDLSSLGQVPGGNYVVIAQDASVPGANLIDSAVNFQNGPDQVALRDSSGNLIDSVCYGTSVDLTCEGGTSAPDPTSLAIARCPDGTDTDDNEADWATALSTTPGASNDTGGCDTAGPMDVTACEVAENDADGAPALGNSLVRLTDLTVISATGTFSTGRLDIAVYDPASGCCITLFDSAIDDTVDPWAVGDVISEVIGNVAFFNGLTEVSNITTLTRGGTAVVPSPTVVTSGDFAANGEQYESCLVEVCGLVIEGGTWPAAGSSANLDVNDGSGPTTMRIDSDTDADGSAAPSEPFTLVGIAGQFDSSAPYDSGYQIRPRSRSDIMDDMSCPVPVETGTWSDLKNQFK